MSDTAPQSVLLDVTDGIATITLNRPDAMNSLDIATKEALLAAVTTAAHDAAVVVVLTRVRLGGDRGAGRFRISPALLNVHTGAGVLTMAVWGAFLFTGVGEGEGHSLIGVIGLAFWWLTTVVGLMILFRWMPSSGKHSSEAIHDTWSTGPGLSVLAHVGMLVGVGVVTWAYLTSAV